MHMSGISKCFGPVRALKNIDFSISPGEVVALLGDNGAGKSTLINIISGNLAADTGQFYFEGNEVKSHSPARAKTLGIETVYQDLTLCTNVDTVANFFMGRELRKKILGISILDEGRMELETRNALADIGTKIPSLHTNVGHLSGGQRQAIELCRFVHWGGKLAVLDEPFAALGVEQTRRGLDLIHRVRQQGIGVIVVTHNIAHAFQIADRIVVLRGGQIVETRDRNEATAEQIVSSITGDYDPPTSSREQ